MKKPFNYNRVCIPGLIALLTLASSVATAAPPNLWWDHQPASAPTQAACVARAEGLMKAGFEGKLSVKKDAVNGRNDTTKAVIECIKHGHEILVMTLVTSSDVESGDKLFNALKTGME